MKIPSTIMICTIIAGFVLACMSPILSAGSVLAAPPLQGTQPPAGEVTPAPDSGESPDHQGPRRRALERLFTREQDWLGRQETNLGRSGEVNSRVEEIIARIEGRGLDPAPIVQALEDFNSSIGTARRDHLKAKAILTIHAGFNDQGNVINLGEAAETVRTAGDNLRSAARTMADALRALGDALRDFRLAHPDEISAPGATE